MACLSTAAEIRSEVRIPITLSHVLPIFALRVASIRWKWNGQNPLLALLGCRLKWPKDRPQSLLPIASGQQVDSFGAHHQGSPAEESIDTWKRWPMTREEASLLARHQVSDGG